MVTLTIDRKTVTVPDGTTILEAARSAKIDIPTLCYLKGINEIGACRLCMVELEDHARLVPACDSAVAEGMVVSTNSPRVREARRVNLRLLLSQHDTKCTKCTRSGNCKLQRLTNDYNLLGDHYEDDLSRIPDDFSNPVVRVENRCFKCMRCIQLCEKVKTMGIWDLMGTGSHTTVGVSRTRTLGESDCTFCGQCITHCPVGGLQERDDTGKVFDALADPDRIVVVQMAPAVRAAWAEYFHLDPKFATAKRMVTALKTMGFDYVFDTDFAADLTIMEEGTELLQRLNKYLAGDRTVKIPLMTSCCPGWVSFMEKHFPELGENLSTAKSPQQMFGAIAKNYLAPKLGIDRRNFIVVSVMPCVAKKSEAARPEFGKDGDPDVNISITTRELAHMIRFANMNFDELEESDFDRPLGESTGAGVIFGTTGGVIEAAVRTAYEIQTKKTLPKLDFTELRGLAGIRSATIDFDGVPVKIGIAHGLGNARRLVEEIRAGRSPYHAIEIMACPGGCINGGGQPYHRGNEELLKRRAEALYAEDAAKPLRKSHENPDIQALYEEFLGEPCGPLSHELLHTRYYDRKPVVEPKK